MMMIDVKNTNLDRDEIIESKKVKSKKLSQKEDQHNTNEKKGDGNAQVKFQYFHIR